MKKRLLSIVGCLLLGIGAIGIVVPVLPTTPFVIGASACFTANPKLQAWLYKNKFFAEHIDNYKQRTGLKRATVIKSLVFLWGLLVVSMVTIGKFAMMLVLLGIGTAVTIHILMIARPKKR